MNSPQKLSAVVRLLFALLILSISFALLRRKIMIRKIRSLIVLVIGLFLMTSGVLLAQNTERHDPTAGVMMERFGNQTWMGVSVSDVSADNARELKLSSDYGAVVNEVKPDSPAAKSGVQKNDVIVEFDGERVRSVAELRRLVRETPPSRTVKIKLIRDGHPRTLSVALESSHGMKTCTCPTLRFPRSGSRHSI